MEPHAPSLPDAVTPAAELRAPLLSVFDDSDVVARLRRSELFVEYQEAFEAATGLPLELVSLASHSTVVRTAGSPLFCRRMGDQAGLCPACAGWRVFLEKASDSEVSHFEAKSGHVFTSIAIKSDAKPIAYFHTGHVFLRRPSHHRTQIHCLITDGDAAIGDRERLMDSFLSTRVVPKAAYLASIRLLSLFATQLASACNRIVVTQSGVVPESIRRACAFIEDNKHRHISFTEVSGAAHMSSFYFCRIFKRTTGLTFGDYLTRVRIESVKGALLNTHTRVSEAAYASGFRSVSQFNRQFRKFTGESPSVFRERMSGQQSLAS